MKTRRKRTLAILGIIACVLLATYGVYVFKTGGLPAPKGKATFDGQSSELKHTQIVATLDEPIERGRNAVWCASFQCAWKALQKDLAGEPISLEGSGRVATSLNNAPDPRPNIPEPVLYVAAGWKQKGVIDRIRRELRQRFPSKKPPTFPGIAENSFVAYSYLEASVKFSVPYFQNRKPMEFVDSSGNKTRINSFGIRPEDDYAYYKLRAQPRILFRKGNPRDEDLEFAMDLCASSSPSQIVVARIGWQPALASALERIENEVAKLEELKKKQPDYATYLEKIGPNDVLLVPDIFWRISHRFSELEGKAFRNRKLKGQRLDVAQQDIAFRLDRSGAELRSESKVYYLPIPTYFVLDRPFLVYMKKRDADVPYFVMWIDNAELLQNWR